MQLARGWLSKLNLDRITIIIRLKDIKRAIRFINKIKYCNNKKFIIKINIIHIIFILSKYIDKICKINIFNEI
jgi:hypothetical protein